MKVIAKGIRKIKSRRAPHLELFNQTRLHLHKGKNFDIVEEAENINSLESLKKKLKNVGTGYFLVEIVDKLCPELVDHDEIYKSLTDSLVKLNSEENINHEHLKENFANDILHKLGYLPQDKNFVGDGLTDFIENIIESRLKTLDIFSKT